MWMYWSIKAQIKKFQKSLNITVFITFCKFVIGRTSVIQLNQVVFEFSHTYADHFAIAKGGTDMVFPYTFLFAESTACYPPPKSPSCEGDLFIYAANAI